MNDKSVPLTGGQVIAVGESVAMSINGPDRSDINDFKGQSQTRLLPDGRIAIAVHESPHWGRPNERLVREVLQGALSLAWGTDVVVNPPEGNEDAAGIDGTVVAPDGKRLVVQIVTVPVKSDYAHRVAQGKQEVELTVDEAVGWIENAIKHKADKIALADRGAMILALDMRHAGVLARGYIVTPAKQKIRPETLGFAEIWLVANVSTYSARLA